MFYMDRLKISTNYAFENANHLQREYNFTDIQLLGPAIKHIERNFSILKSMVVSTSPHLHLLVKVLWVALYKNLELEIITSRKQLKQFMSSHACSKLLELSTRICAYTSKDHLKMWNVRCAWRKVSLDTVNETEIERENISRLKTYIKK